MDNTFVCKATYCFNEKTIEGKLKVFLDQYVFCVNDREILWQEIYVCEVRLCRVEVKIKGILWKRKTTGYRLDMPDILGEYVFILANENREALNRFIQECVEVEAKKREAETLRIIEERKRRLEERKRNKEKENERESVIKKEFSDSFAWIKKNVVVSDKWLSQMVFEAPIQAKRAGQYIESSRMYSDMVRKYQALTPSIAKGWYKTLACAGDLEDAFRIAEYTCDQFLMYFTKHQDELVTEAMAHALNECNMLYAQIQYMRSLIEAEKYDEMLSHIKAMSGNSTLNIRLEQIDMYIEALKKKKEQKQEKKIEEEEQREEERQKREEEQRKQMEQEKISEAAAEVEQMHKQEEIGSLEKAAQEEAALQKIGVFHTKLAGVTHFNTGSNSENRQLIIRDLQRKGMLENGQELKLVQEPTNPYDRNAIMVLGPDGRQIGYLSRQVAAEVTRSISQNIIYRAFISDVTGGSIGYAYGVNVRIESYKRIAEEATVLNVQNGNQVERKSYSAYDDYYEYAESIYDIARGEGFSIDDDGHWVPYEESEW